MMANEERIRNAIKEDSSKHLTIEQWDIRTIMDKHPLERVIEGARKEQQEKDIQRAVEWLKETYIEQYLTTICSGGYEEHKLNDMFFNDLIKAMKG